MQIAYLMAQGRGDTDLVLARLANRLVREGLRTCGVVQINTDCCEAHPCDKDVRVLSDGPVIRISQSLASLVKGCRLDPSALEQAVALVEARMIQGVDVLIINKFGKHEAEGRGFRNLIAEALSLSVQAIVGVNTANFAAFQRSTEGLAVPITVDVDLLAAWLSAMAKADGPGFGAGDRITLAIDIARIGVDLVEKHPARGHRPQDDCGVRAGQDQLPAGEAFPEDRVPGIPRSGGQDQRPQIGAFLDQRIDPLL